MIEPGQSVGNYRVLAKIGEGGMGDVYLAEHPVIGRKAALKVIHPQHARNADVVARFVNEASAISRIGHEHIVEVTDFGRTPEGDFYFIMEYLEGLALSDLIGGEAPFPPARALAIAAQIADALAASHAHGVIHRDLKPENVFLVARGEDTSFVKVLDFGLAKLVHDDGAAPHQTRTGIVMGTPYYMAPEQCEGASQVDERADVYALGVVLFEMLTGKLPFGGHTPAEVLVKQMTMRAPMARSVIPELPEELDAILHRALAKAPAQRFPSMAAFKEVLLTPSAHALLPPVIVDEDPTGRMRAARPMARAEIGRLPRRPGTRGAALVGMAALTCLSLSAGGTFWWIDKRSGPAGGVEYLPAMVTLSFSSDPDGATVRDPKGTALGTTPLSIRVARTEAPVEYLFQKPGFEEKTMALIPNVPSSVFAAMQTLGDPPSPYPTSDAALDDDDAVAAPERAAAATRGHHGRSATRLRDDPDIDGVLAPSFLKK